MTAPAIPPSPITVQEVRYFDTLAFAHVCEEGCPRLERALRQDAKRAYVERDRAGRPSPPIVVDGVAFPYRLRLQRPTDAAIERVCREVDRERAVITRADRACDALLPSDTAAAALLGAMRDRAALSWCSTDLRAVGDGWYLGASPGQNGIEGVTLVGYGGRRASRKHPGSRHVAHSEMRCHGARVVKQALGRLLEHPDRVWERVLLY